MHREVRIQNDDFDVASEWREARRRCGGDVGAIVAFGGLVRDRVKPGELDGSIKVADAVRGLYLEHYPGMTEASIDASIDTAVARWDLLDVVVIHRVGDLAPADQIVFVQVASSHRPDAFAACEFLMDYLKTDAVFWKKERRAGGEAWIESTKSDTARRDSWEQGTAQADVD